jgi:hypothetical protein
VIAITIAANGQTRTYLNDGKMAVGMPLKLGTANLQFETAGQRPASRVLGIADRKQNGETASWYSDGYAAMGTSSQLGSSYIAPFVQHETIYSFKTGLAQSEPNPPMFEAIGPIALARSGLDALHEPVLGPGMENVAMAHGDLSVFRKTGERIMKIPAATLFSDFLDGSSDPVRNLNSFSGLGNCLSDYPQTDGGHGFCVHEVYDSRAAYDSIGKRFVFLAQARNTLWQRPSKFYWEDHGGPTVDECSAYWDPSEIERYSFDYCNSARRYLMIAVSVSENPADGFHLCAVKESNYRDWPTLAVVGNQLIVGHKNAENRDGYAALVFDLSAMRSGAKRPRFFRLDQSNLDNDYTLSVPRTQDNQSVLTVGIGSSGRVFGFSKTHQGYTAPSLVWTSATLFPSEAWVYWKGALRIAKEEEVEKRSKRYAIHYGRYPVTTTATSIDVKVQAADQAMPYKPLLVPNNVIKSYDCARLGVTTLGDEVIGFSAVRALGTKAGYDASVVRRRYNETSFGKPTSYAAGQQVDPDSLTSGFTLVTDPRHCQQQGAAERDPEGGRVWVAHNYGLNATKSVVGALGFVSFP